jgi:hypothetical protein
VRGAAITALALGFVGLAVALGPSHPLLIGPTLLLLGAVGTAASVSWSRKAKAVRSWPTVPGRILDRGLADHRGGKLSPHLVMGPRTYVPYVKYAYSVDGRDYVNDRVYFGASATVAARGGRGAEAATRFVEGLPDPIPVRYDPRDPAQSFLLILPRWTYWLLEAIGIAMILAGLLALLMHVAPAPA